MTAEVAVMNSQGVAIAADSAVTIGDKTYFTQQKIFSLSQKHSLGIMIFGNNRFMDVDLEIIIYEFRKALEAVGDRVSDTLKEYPEYLINVLHNIKYIDTNEKDYLSKVSNNLFNLLKNDYNDEIPEDLKKQEITKAQQNKIMSGTIKKVWEKLEKIDNLAKFMDDEYLEANKEIITKEMEKVFSDIAINNTNKEELLDLYRFAISKDISVWDQDRTGIVFTGYGAKEVFPSAIAFYLIGRLGKNILHTEFDIKAIDMRECGAWIIPYSQDNVIQSFLRGMDPNFRLMIDNELDKLTENITNIKEKKYKEYTEEINQKIKELKEKMVIFEEENYTKPVADNVASLPKSNLVGMAEFLVNLTAWRQHVSTERETVGGLVDVALITKTDGFVWIKKKQMF